MKTIKKTKQPKTPKRDKPYYITIGTQLQDARDDLQAAIVLAVEHAQQARVKSLWKAIGLIDKVRDVLDEDLYQDGLYEKDLADGIRHPLDTGRQRAGEAARKLEELTELMMGRGRRL